MATLRLQSRLYKELVTFLLLFGIISAIYRYVLNENQKKLIKKKQKFAFYSSKLIISVRIFIRRYFVDSKAFFQSYIDHLSGPFLLGFDVTTVAGRWWAQYLTIPWPDKYRMMTDFFPF
jgi:hypothetical protein